MGIMIIRIGNMIEDLRDKMIEDLIDNSREDLIDNMIEDPICRDLLKEEITTRESIQIISILLLIIEIIVLLFGKE
jgi:nickel-dependent lactate racemase